VSIFLMSFKYTTCKKNCQARILVFFNACTKYFLLVFPRIISILPSYRSERGDNIAQNDFVGRLFPALTIILYTLGQEFGQIFMIFLKEFHKIRVLAVGLPQPQYRLIR
jgi:hypothetical protein